MKAWWSFLLLASFSSCPSKSVQIFLAAFLFYAAVVIIAVLILIFHYIPEYGQTHILFYIGVCSLVGSLSVCILLFFSEREKNNPFMIFTQNKSIKEILCDRS